MVADEAAHFWSIPGDVKEFVGQFGEFELVVLHVENVGEDVDVIDAEWIDSENGVELHFGALVLFGAISRCDLSR